MFKLKWPDHPSPFWFYSGRNVHFGLVNLHDGNISAEGNTLELLEGVAPPPGTELRITRKHLFLLAETKAEFEERTKREAADCEVDAKARREAAERRYVERQQHYQQRATDENAKLRIPVRWTSGLKTVLSGLSAQGLGTGENARSVTHILLLEAIDDGKFKRPARAFLCTSAGGTNGQNWMQRLDTHSTGPDGPYVSQITCRQCLRLAQRWAGIKNPVSPELIL